MTITREECLARDAADPLGPMRKRFALERLDEQGRIYLDGKSPRVLPKAGVERRRHVVEDEWGLGLVRSWNSAGWITLAHRVGDKIARLIGAAPGEVAVADSTSVNLHKVLSAALAGVRADAPQPQPQRRRIVSERTNFPTDLYIADTLARAQGFELVLVEAEEIRAHLDERLAVLLLTHVNYRTGCMHQMPEVTRAVHDAGGLMIWDLAHSAGAMPLDISGSDFAVGCGYKYLNGGPGAPAFAWAHPRHLARMDREDLRQALSGGLVLAGWMGHGAPFAFTADYRPADGMTRFLCGTPPILSLAALECGVDTLLGSADFGGLAAIRRKSVALGELFIDLVESRCAG